MTSSGPPQDAYDQPQNNTSHAVQTFPQQQQPTETAPLNQEWTMQQFEEDGSGSFDHQLHDAFARFQASMRACQIAIADGRCSDASSILYHVTEWVVQNAERLGLTTDDAELYDQRFSFWRDLNDNWSNLFHRNVGLLSDNHAPVGTQRLNEMQLGNLGQHIIRWSDILERFGLVDYDLGLQEDRCLKAIEACFDQWRAYWAHLGVVTD
ncbi:hypothetical protein SAICODRAFT_33078 [Saitoella complicata NRRL Y-17804]|uniref:uncharacterized protein n=1 Tax=Saitoella complicata (strain BCRC 22490 / CBS 7301 / JCM 7358 / NBRC 10748 / NRRL Y-17804) TaxID=698492 RepID=UPI000867E66A|nr:uncharacterized protein SAICODRAFT_33078 [Saitoella complicata NRRL Y-17804]ODQ55695.1 hypothetical protein SAICODRAFT_33078 [Saitoella complicata NRRL Y-17804]